MLRTVLGEVGSHGDEPAEVEVRCLRAAGRAAVVCIGHQNLIEDHAAHRSLAQAGAYVAFDTLGKDAYQSDSTRLELVLSMIEADRADRVLLSNDVSRDGYLFRATGGYGHLFASFLPALAAAGVDSATMRMMVRDNALRFLCGDDGSADRSRSVPASNGDRGDP
jgi:phosphotriesterase-related protein